MKIHFMKNQSGFTLIEVLIALVIFSIGILAVNAMQITSIKGNNKSARISEATNIAMDTMEGLLSLDFDDSALNDDDGADDGTDTGDGTAQDTDPAPDGADDDGDNYGLDDIANPDGAAVSIDGNYNIYWNIANDYPMTSETLNNSVKTIKVIVTWNEGTGTKSLSMTNIKVSQQ